MDFQKVRWAALIAPLALGACSSADVGAGSAGAAGADHPGVGGAGSAAGANASTGAGGGASNAGSANGGGGAAGTDQGSGGAGGGQLGDDAGAVVPMEGGRSTSDAAQPAALWVGDMETGDWSQYDRSATWNFEGSPVPPWPTLVSADNDSTHVRQGRYAQRFHLDSGQKRQELITNNDAPTFKEGDDYYFGFSLYVDPATRTSSWCAVVQWKNDGTGSPPLEFEINSSSGFEMQGGFGHPSGAKNHVRTVPGGFTTGVWIKWVIHVKFSSNTSVGWYEIYKDDVLVLPKFSPPGGTLYPGLGSYHKHGLYCDPANTGVRTVWQDDWRIGKTYESVAPR